MKKLLALALLWGATMSASAQDYNQLTDDGEFTSAEQRRDNRRSDSIQSQHKEIPKGLKVWTVDERFGDRTAAIPDTLHYMFMNSIFTSGRRGEYNTLGNLGSPRINRIFTDRRTDGDFVFTHPYDFFVTRPDEFHFTNTLSPITNLVYNNCGNRTNGEDHFKALFAVNAGKRIGVGFKFDYIYGRGFYADQSTSHFNYSMWGSYMGDRYQAHLLIQTNHEKVAENGGITDDNYITHPESFNESYRENEIPTVLTRNWNRNNNTHIFLTHRYSLGFSRKVPMTEEEIKAKKFAMESQKENAAADAKEEARKRAKREGRDFDEQAFDKTQTFSGRPDNAKIAGDESQMAEHTSDSLQNHRIKVDSSAAADSILSADKKKAEADQWMKTEYVPVTSFIHTARFDTYSRIYQAYETPENYYANLYEGVGKALGDSIYDKTDHYSFKNTFAIALLEGFNKWAKAGLKVFATSDLRHFTLPNTDGTDASFTEHNLSVGGQLAKKEGTLLHYNVTGEAWLVGKDAGQLRIDATADLNFRLLGDTVQLAANAFFHRDNQNFYYRHYQSKHFWWSNDDLSKTLHTHLEGRFTWQRTNTRLRFAYDNLQNYTYLGQSYTITADGRTGQSVAVRQAGQNISVITASIAQDFRLGPLHWDNVLTYQKSTDNDALPLPALNVYTNLYLRFKIAHVLDVDMGADARYFTKYYAPDYSPALGQFTSQEGESRVEVGNFPVINAYVNFNLKHTRFFVMMSHVNSGSNASFLVPHYPVNSSIFRFGLSWNFFN